MIRRLNKNRHAAFSGRILTLVANAFPLTERSGVNARGDFNIENTTVVEENDLMDLEGDSVMRNLKDFYNYFWGAQKYFSDPMLLFKEKKDSVESNFQEFQKQVENIVDKFGSYQKTRISSSSPEKVKSTNASSYIQLESKVSVAAPESRYFFPKFLTSWRLFEMQVLFN